MAFVSLLSTTGAPAIALASATCPANGFLATTSPVHSKPRIHMAKSKLVMQASAFGPNKKVNIAILGASGYTGAELVRLLANHPYANIVLMTAEKNAGQKFGSVFPQYLYGTFANNLPTLVKIDEIKSWDGIDIVFCCLPHATTQEIIMKLPLDKLKVIDLSADFRFSDVNSYAKWYGGEHKCPDLQKQAVYGLVELARDAVKNARLLANPGCYPTAAQLPLIPLLRDSIIQAEDIIIDAKSGTTGAGRAAKVNTLFCEVSDGIHAYAVATHRHAPEIEQGLSQASKKNVIINFTPHLMPINRGILETIYVKLEPGKTVDDMRACLEKQYANEMFVHVLPPGTYPETRHVRGTNHVIMNVAADRVPGRAIIISAIDNVNKGASGQALQNMNIMCGLPEYLGLEQAAMFP